MRAGNFGMAGLRDPHLVQHPDGGPYVRVRLQGTRDAPYVTNIPHPQIVPLPDGGHLMVTFDGTQYGESVLGYGGHGDVIVMSAVGG